MPARRFCVAPMMDWTDRHCRYFHRLLSQHTWLYTEMVTTGALLYGDVRRHLEFHESEHPIALQLGGSEPKALAHAAKLGEQWGYDEINLNCGCPSPRVQRGAFGACLMAEPELVADCVVAMREATTLPVTVKHRIGLDDSHSYAFVRDFVGTVAQAGCRVFIVHARNAILQGLSPKENREIPPLRYAFAYQLKQDFPELEIILNGGITTAEDIQAHWQQVDGVMVGRHAYHQPYLLAQVDQLIQTHFAPPPSSTNVNLRSEVTELPLRQDRCVSTEIANVTQKSMSREQVEELICAYFCEQMGQGASLQNMMRHILGLYHGQAGARGWRRVLSDHRALAAVNNAHDLIALFTQAKKQLAVCTE